MILQTWHTYTGTELASRGQKTCIFKHISTDIGILIHYLGNLKIQAYLDMLKSKLSNYDRSCMLSSLIKIGYHQSNHLRFSDIVVNTIWYLGDMLCSGGGCDSAIGVRCCVAWGKFRKLLPVLTTKHISPWIYAAMCIVSKLVLIDQWISSKRSFVEGFHNGGEKLLCRFWVSYRFEEWIIMVNYLSESLLYSH